MGCLFCKIAAKEIPSAFIYEDAEFVVIEDINPRAKLHYLVLPKKHYEQSPDILDADDPEVIGRMWQVAKYVANDAGLNKTGYRIAMNLGPDAGQAINHYHMHLLGGGKLGPEG